MSFNLKANSVTVERHQHLVNFERLIGNKLLTTQPSHITVKWQNMKTEIKIYRVQLVFNDTVALYENDKVTVFVTENEQEAKRVFEKLSENKNLKYILR